MSGSAIAAAVVVAAAVAAVVTASVALPSTALPAVPLSATVARPAATIENKKKRQCSRNLPQAFKSYFKNILKNFLKAVDHKMSTSFLGEIESLLTFDYPYDDKP